MVTIVDVFGARQLVRDVFVQLFSECAAVDRVVATSNLLVDLAVESFQILFPVESERYLLNLDRARRTVLTLLAPAGRGLSLTEWQRADLREAWRRCALGAHGGRTSTSWTRFRNHIAAESNLFARILRDRYGMLSELVGLMEDIFQPFTKFVPMWVVTSEPFLDLLVQLYEAPTADARASIRAEMLAVRSQVYTTRPEVVTIGPAQE